MISRHHSPLVQPSNSGRASTWSIFAESAAESLSQMGTDVSSDRPGRAMRSNYPERASTTGNAATALPGGHDDRHPRGSDHCDAHRCACPETIGVLVQKPQAPAVTKLPPATPCRWSGPGSDGQPPSQCDIAPVLCVAM